MPISSASTSLFDLPLDVQVKVAWLLGRDGASLLSRTCRDLHNVGRSDALWYVHDLRKVREWGGGGGKK